jgi:hypothetical protein
VAAFLLATSRLASSLEARDVPRRLLKGALPGLLLAGGLVVLSRRLGPNAALETAFGAVVVATSVLLAVRVGARVRAALARPEPHASPFL